MEDYSINISVEKKKIQRSPVRQQKLSIAIFPIISLWELYISCNSNQSSYPIRIKNTTYIEANILSMYAKFQPHPIYGFSGEDFSNFYEN